MKKSLTALESVEKQFTALRSSRPNELDGVAGFEALNYTTFEAIFANWREQLVALSDTRWAETPTASLADIALAKTLSDFSTLIAQGQPNGVQWLLNSGLPERSLNIGQSIAQLADRRAGIIKHLAKDLATLGIKELGAVIEAGPLTADLHQRVDQANAALKELNKRTEEAGTLATQVTGSAQGLAALQNEIAEAHTYFVSTRSEVARLHGEMNALRLGTESKAVELEGRVDALKTSVDTGNKVLGDATESLRGALSDVKKKGLAEAFTSRAKKVVNERYIWLLIFVAAAFGLVLSSQAFASELSEFTYEGLLVALLRRAGLAGPLIWLGWYAAKQVGRLNRVHEDYEYKAATALAFESYRNEVAASGDASLMKDLLESTIKNFGDNPVRLYDGHLEDHATPTEQLLARVEADGTLGFIKRCAALIPGRNN